MSVLDSLTDKTIAWFEQEENPWRILLTHEDAQVRWAAFELLVDCGSDVLPAAEWMAKREPLPHYQSAMRETLAIMRRVRAGG